MKTNLPLSTYFLHLFSKGLIIALALMASLAASATQYSKLSIITSAKARGCWPAIKAFIASADVQDEWDACQYLSDDYAQFPALTNLIVTSGVCSSGDLIFVMTNSVDTAVSDAALRRVYDNDVKNASGRVKWHGKLVLTTIDTNSFKRVMRYADGTEFTERATTPLDRVQASNRRLAAQTNGVPARLAAARARFIAESSQTNTVTKTITAGQ